MTIVRLASRGSLTVTGATRSKSSFDIDDAFSDEGPESSGEALRRKRPFGVSNVIGSRSQGRSWALVLAIAAMTLFNREDR